MVRGKYVNRYDIKSTDGYILRNRIEHWLDAQFVDLESCDPMAFLGVSSDIFVVVDFLNDICLINDDVARKYHSIVSKIIEEREDL